MIQLKHCAYPLMSPRNLIRLIIRLKSADPKSAAPPVCVRSSGWIKKRKGLHS